MFNYTKTYKNVRANLSCLTGIYFEKIQFQLLYIIIVHASKVIKWELNLKKKINKILENIK